jgi:hypothetical protein
LDEQTAKKIALAVATSVGSFVAGTKIAAWAFGWILAIPSAGVSLVAGMAGNAALNAKVTNAVGKAVALYFLQTTEIESSDVIIAILVALVGTQFGIPSGRHDIIA